MESCKLTYHPENKFNYFKNLHIFFYSWDPNHRLNLLLNKQWEQNLFYDINTSIQEIDGSPIISLSRILTTKYQGLFTDSNLNSLSNSISISLKDLVTFEHYTNDNNMMKNLPANLLLNSECYKEWIEKLFHPQIQYDNIQGKIIYFFELPYLDIEKLNKNLLHINYPFEFKNFPYDDLKNNTEFIEKGTLLICNFFDMRNHIIDTLKTKYNDDYDNYIVYSLEIKEKSGVINLNRGSYEYIQLAGNLRRNKENWLFIKDKIPDKAILNKRCKAVIIPGSESSVYDYEPHTLEAISWLRKFRNCGDCEGEGDSNHNGIKLLGVCFGHQLISDAFGGQVRKITTEKFIKYVEIVNIDKKFWELKFVKDCELNECDFLKIFEVHGDEVSLVPRGFNSYGGSESSKYEIIVSDDENIFTTQGHPELTPANMYSTVIDNQDLNYACFLSNLNIYVEEKEFQGSSDREIFFRLYHSFLKN